MQGASQSYCLLPLSARDRAYRAKQRWRMQNHLQRGNGWSPLVPARGELPPHTTPEYERRLVRRRSKWLFLAVVVPGCANPLKCKACQGYFRPDEYRKSSRRCRGCDRLRKRRQLKRMRAERPDDYRIQRRMAKHRRRARLKGNGGSVKPAEWRSILVAHGGRCVRCGCGGVMTQDHILPISLGGRHEAGNLQPMCHRCNSLKSATVTGATQTLLSGLLTFAHAPPPSP